MSGVDLSTVTPYADSGGIADGDLGDVTVSGQGSVVTIDTDVVSNAKLADMAPATIKGNNTGGAANPLDLTAAQVKVLLAIAEGDVTGLVADLAAKQPLDADLTAIAALTATTDNILQSVAGVWASRTPAQVKAALAIANTDVSGLGTLSTKSTVATADITDDAVTNAKAANMVASTIKGRLSTTGDPQDLTATQVTALLDLFTTSLKGLVPSGGSNTTYLRGDGTWQTIVTGSFVMNADEVAPIVQFYGIDNAGTEATPLTESADDTPLASPPTESAATVTLF